MWNSQPCRKGIPIGNILLSAAILYSGALPAKMLLMLKILGCVSITSRTYFRHQRHYLQPAILSVWNKHQAKIIKQLQLEKRPLVLGGDGRADSPGHSAKLYNDGIKKTSCSQCAVGTGEYHNTSYSGTSEITSQIKDSFMQQTH